MKIDTPATVDDDTRTLDWQDRIAIVSALLQTILLPMLVVIVLFLAFFIVLVFLSV